MKVCNSKKQNGIWLGSVCVKDIIVFTRDQLLCFWDPRKCNKPAPLLLGKARENLSKSCRKHLGKRFVIQFGKNSYAYYCHYFPQSTVSLYFALVPPPPFFTSVSLCGCKCFGKKEPVPHTQNRRGGAGSHSSFLHCSALFSLHW